MVMLLVCTQMSYFLFEAIYFLIHNLENKYFDSPFFLLSSLVVRHSPLKSKQAGCVGFEFWSMHIIMHSFLLDSTPSISKIMQPQFSFWLQFSFTQFHESACLFWLKVFETRGPIGDKNNK